MSFDKRRIEKLSECFRHWLAMDTWDSHHPLDTKRFNLAVHFALRRFRNPIAWDEYLEAFKLQSQHHAHFQRIDAQTLTEKLEPYAHRAAMLETFVRDSGR